MITHQLQPPQSDSYNNNKDDNNKKEFNIWKVWLSAHEKYGMEWWTKTFSSGLLKINKNQPSSLHIY